ncbi:MAG: hypothetical protein GF317_07015 [Candidatus Lokiarchaeota archaeon]|nr:hypothetical protein [Candidatus Lokiarchaeota archaeon]MBD3199459.1 hypothetical protein [Candidatus Lokiarchaeota archaeon]
MGAFQWLMKRVTKAFGRNTSSLFYNLLYREILKEVNEITNDENISLLVMRDIGKKAARESCERHSAVFKFMPGSPEKVIEYFEILWVVVFGKELENLEYEEIKKENSRYNDYILKIQNCPICAGYGSSEGDSFNVIKIDAESEGMACGLCGMLESVANFILKVKKNDYRISIKEQKCMAKGDECLQLLCEVYGYNEWKELKEKEAKEKSGFETFFDEESEEEFIQDSKLDFLDKLQDAFSLDKLEEILDEPLENIKTRLADIIRDKLNMEPENFFDYFRNYEDDMIRIIGFLGIHLINELGGVIEKTFQNETVARAAGYLFKQLKDTVLLFIPLDVVRDYHNLLINFLEGLAPEEMIENIRQYSGRDDINFIFEGAQMALEDLGINFSELKENVWEELKREREDGLISPETSVVDRTQEQFPKIIQILQELVMLITEIFTLPVRISISETHHGVKTAINSVVSEEEGLAGSIKTRFDRIFDNLQALRQ